MNNFDSSKLKKRIFELVGCSYDKEIEITQYDGLLINHSSDKTVIGCNSISALARGYFLLAKEMRNSENFVIEQNPVFDNCGVFLDVSQNGVLTVDAVKKYIDCISALGMNALMLYMEDMYELKDYPYFGYMRGRYSEQELIEIDNYAFEMGVEVVPCIQVLGHMSKYLKWKEAKPVRDTGDVLLVENEDTYKFIESAVSTLKRVFRSKKINIGMDEAKYVGTGEYLRVNGYRHRNELLNNHLKRVIEICNKCGFTNQMMWSDMYIKTQSKTGRYYDPNTSIPPDVAEKIPNIDMVFWDYYHDDKDLYDTLFNIHSQLKKKIVFAGGIDIWSGFLPRHDFIVNNSVAALKSCIDNNIKDVCVTTWGDDGNETNVFMALPYLPLYSEYCWRGADCTIDDITSVSEFLTKIPFDDIAVIGNNPIKINGKDFFAKSLVYTDLFFNFSVMPEECSELFARYKELAALTAKMDNKFSEYVSAIYRICAVKAGIIAELRSDYCNKDKTRIRELAKCKLPQLINLYEELLVIMRKQWLEVYKPFGFEVMCLRIGGLIARIKDVIITLNDFCDEKIDEIYELEEKVLPTDECMLEAARLISSSELFFNPEIHN